MMFPENARVPRVPRSRRPELRLLLALACLAFITPASSALPVYVASQARPPAVPREFRAAWVASVSNIDWPSKPGLTSSQQKAELLAILDRAAQLRLNAIILQVRPACDALYPSTLEPWSEYLTGKSGKAPDPFYDPLALAVAEAHQRGMELHAWINPFRARHSSAKSPNASTHVSQAKPNLVRTYGRMQWLDPSERTARDHSLKVILEIVRRYDVDGIHMDDYFYPYREKGPDGGELDFPDDANWKKYLGAGGKLSRADWRREHINQFIEQAYHAVKTEKRWVKFGVSPFGIWRPGFPEQIRGYDPYDKLYADSRKWLQQGWLDYFAPQLYWAIEAREQSFPVLLKWWHDQNAKGRHIWPGIADSRLGTVYKAEQITEQIRLTRSQSSNPGHIHWNMKALMQNREKIGEALTKHVYADQAATPACPWLGKDNLSKPKIYAGGNPSTGLVTLSWHMPGATQPRWWLVQAKQGASWTTRVFPPSRNSLNIYNNQAPPAVFAVTPADRYGNLGEATVLELKP